MDRLVVILFASIIILGQSGCGDKSKQESEGEISLEGTWKLVKVLNSDDEEAELLKHSEDLVYLKHITPTHFTWVRFNRESNELEGTGGGTYTFDGNTYTENLDFFFPPGSNELGQSIPFTVEMKNGTWHHKGYAKVMEFDPEIAELVVVDSSIIDELWERTEVQPKDGTGEKLVGTWDLVSYKDQNDSIWSEYPEFIGYLKTITPTHFIWVQYRKGGDEVMALGGGTYKVNGDEYVESLNYWYPKDPGFVDINAVFDYELEDNRWTIEGEVRGKKEVTPIEEIWKRYVGKKLAQVK